MADKYIQTEHKELLIYIFLAGLVYLIPLLFGFVKRGFSESFVTGEPIRFGTYLASFSIYQPFMYISLLLILFPLAKMVILRNSEHPAVKRAKDGFQALTVSFIFAPEENGLLYFLSEKTGFKGDKNWMKWSKNPLRVIMASILVFGALGLVILGNPQLAGAGIPGSQAQQISIGSDIAFNSLIPAFSENGTILFIFSLLMGILAFFISRTKQDADGKKITWFGAGILAVIVSGLLFGGLHAIVYGASDIKFLSTVIFGIIGVFITLLTGTLIPWFIYHFMNNLFVTLREVVGASEDVKIIVGLILFGILALWVGVEMLNKKIRKKI